MQPRPPGGPPHPDPEQPQQRPAQQGQDPDPQQHRAGQHPDGGQRQPAEGELAGVGDCDHGDGGDVVDHGQREQERLGPGRDSGAEQGQDPDGEGGVGGHGDGPAPGRRAAGVEGQEDQGRDGRPGQGGQDGQAGPAGVAEASDGELAFDLQPDDQEEDGHQGVVDPMPHIPRQAPHGQLLLPQALVGVGHRAVGQGQGGDGGGQQDPAAHGLDAQELHHRVQDAADPVGAPSKRHRGAPALEAG
jgi:hypothetical protein